MSKDHRVSISSHGALRLIARVDRGRLDDGWYRFRHYLALTNASDETVTINDWVFTALDGDGTKHQAVLDHQSEWAPLYLDPHASTMVTSLFLLPTHWGTIDGWVDALEHHGRVRRVDCHRVICRCEFPKVRKTMV